MTTSVRCNAFLASFLSLSCGVATSEPRSPISPARVVTPSRIVGGASRSTPISTSARGRPPTPKLWLDAFGFGRPRGSGTVSPSEEENLEERLPTRTRLERSEDGRFEAYFEHETGVFVLRDTQRGVTSRLFDPRFRLDAETAICCYDFHDDRVRMVMGHLRHVTVSFYPLRVSDFHLEGR